MTKHLLSQQPPPPSTDWQPGVEANSNGKLMPNMDGTSAAQLQAVQQQQSKKGCLCHLFIS